MAKDKDAYEHSGKATGFGADHGPSPETEHRDTTSGESAEERNELAPEGRKDQPGPYGPRTHDNTKITRKEGS